MTDIGFTIPAVTHAPHLDYDKVHPGVIWTECSGCGWSQGPSWTEEDAYIAFVDHRVDFGLPRVEVTHRPPADGEEAVAALRSGILERDMTGIPHGPDGWERCRLAESAVRDGLGKFRVPVDWKADS